MKQGILVGIFLAIILAYGLYAHWYPNYRIDQMEKFFNGTDFINDKNAALMLGKAERDNYYLIAERYPLDGAYSESYIDGIYELVRKYGKVMILNEVDLLRIKGSLNTLQHIIDYKFDKSSNRSPTASP